MRPPDKGQALHVLHDIGNDCFCCLGIGCKLFFPDEMKVMVEGDDGDEYPLDNAIWFGAEEVAPPHLIEVLSLHDDLGTIDLSHVNDEDREMLKTFYDPGGAESLVQMNDAEISFKDIAAFIRRNPKAVFRKVAE